MVSGRALSDTDTATIVKASMFNMPVISWFLRQWGAIPVERQGRDSSSVRAMLQVLRSGGVMAVAAESCARLPERGITPRQIGL